MKKIIIFSLLLVCSSAQADKWIIGVVSKIYSGDLIEVDGILIKLYGIRSPKLRQPYGKIARDFLGGNVLNKEIKVKIVKVRCKTISGFVLLNNSTYNELMVASGLAWSDIVSTYFYDLQQMAKRQRFGLWEDTNPIPPWKFGVKKSELIPQPKNKPKCICVEN